jgi:preprotein translocase subunit SecE
MGRTAAGALFAAVMVVVIVGVDLLFFRGHFWGRLTANVGIVLIAVAFYARFVHRP